MYKFAGNQKSPFGIASNHILSLLHTRMILISTIHTITVGQLPSRKFGITEIRLFIDRLTMIGIRAVKEMQVYPRRARFRAH